MWRPKRKEDHEMTEAIWTYARLDAHGIELVEEAERTLGADCVVVYAEGDPRRDVPANLPFKAAPLDDSQLECLRGLESQLGGVAVAYRLP
jgi:hypothetical protein